jgi:predicted N-acyltransferase
MPHARFLSSITEISPATWNALFASDNPFVQHAFLLALEDSGCAGGDTGWQPQHLALFEGERPVAALPLYLKMHSYGEFVFDWGWAEAYARHGLEYYPKLLTAIPFSPVTGPRVGISTARDTTDTLETMVGILQELCQEHSFSGWHLLFPDEHSDRWLESVADDMRILKRRDVQFHWHNHGYDSFDEFLGTFRSSRRKNLKRERRLVAEQGVTLERNTGSGINGEDWEGFYKCYCSTYQKRSGHSGYLTRAFFRQLLDSMREQLMLVVARRDGVIVASALFLFDSRTLYGRYWGALEDVHCLHFEACFYQGIEFCIEQGIDKFDPGTQGEHKLMRGFEPVHTTSWHWLADGRFHAALKAYLDKEKRGTESYREMARQFLPFKRGD